MLELLLGRPLLPTQQSVAQTPHPGWQGNAIDGEASTSLPQGTSGARITAAVTNVPTTGVLELSFRAWAPYTSYGGDVNLVTSQAGTKVALQAWTNMHYNNVWMLYADTPFTGSSTVLWWISPPQFMRNTTVQASLSLDYDNDQFWARLDDGPNQVTSPKFPFLGGQQITGISVYEDDRGNSLGLDVDDIVLTSRPQQ